MNCLNLCDECFDICFWISTTLFPLLAYVVLQGLRPRLTISTPSDSEKQLDCIEVKVVNNSWFFDANNIRIEICAYSKQGLYTFHFEPDHAEFLILPTKGVLCKGYNTKKFVCRKAADSALAYLNKDDKEGEESYTKKTGFTELLSLLESDYQLRVRCHAYHSISGLGKSFEQTF